jgi:hypothetical protein
VTVLQSAAAILAVISGILAVVHLLRGGDVIVSVALLLVSIAVLVIALGAA